MHFACCFFFFSSRRRHTRLQGDWSSDVCSSDLLQGPELLLRQQLFLAERRLAGVGHHVALEVQDFLEVLEVHIQQRADAARDTLQEPDVRHRRRQLDMPHALPPHLGLNHFDAALITDDAAVLHPLVLAADRKSTRLNSSHLVISYAVFCLKKKKKEQSRNIMNDACLHTN